MNEVDSFLEKFNHRVGRVRGDSIADKLETLRNRYLKIALDSIKEYENGNDISAYRYAYASVHESCGNLIVDFEDATPEYVSFEIVDHLVELVEA